MFDGVNPGNTINAGYYMYYDVKQLNFNTQRS